MAYSMDPLQDNCYENSSVLINKFNIRDGKKLEEIEQNITSALIAKALIDIPFDNVNFDFYKKLHEYVFTDLYEWAGQIRKVNMSKKGTSFCAFNKIEDTAHRIFTRLQQNNYLADCQDCFIDEFTELYCDLNYLHPFREGNGRIQRLFLSMLLTHIGKKLDFSLLDKDIFMIATIKAIKGDTFLLKDVFKQNIK